MRQGIERQTRGTLNRRKKAKDDERIAWSQEKMNWNDRETFFKSTDSIFNKKARTILGTRTISFTKVPKVEYLSVLA